VQLTTTCEHNSSKRAGVKETNKWYKLVAKRI
jgi:hypothetical protein